MTFKNLANGAQKIRQIPKTQPQQQVYEKMDEAIISSKGTCFNRDIQKILC